MRLPPTFAMSRAVAPSRWVWRAVLAALMAVALLLWQPASATSHEVPPSVVVHAFVKPVGDEVRVLVRVPLEAMRDVDFPLRATGALDFARAGPALRDAAKLWVADALVLYAGGVRLDPPTLSSVRASLPSERAFGSFDDAAALLAGVPVAPDTEIPWTQAMLDVALTYRAPRGAAELSMEPALAHLGVRTTTVLHYLPRVGDERVLTYDGDPGVVDLEMSWARAALQFAQRGIEHILSGVDHLLFLLCLVIPFRQARPVIALVTAFTVAHSITLVASAAGYAPDALWFPPLIEVLIATSIVYMACENVLGARIERRWPMAFAFGLVHGFGFSFALRDTLQFAGTHLAISLAAFNVGVELGQLAVLAAVLPVLHLAVSKFPERSVAVLLSALVGHQAWHWMTDRFATLRQYRFTWPALDALFVQNASRALAVAVLSGALVWVLTRRVRRWLTPSVSTLLFMAALVLAPRVSAAQKLARSTRSGVYTDAQARAGREVFVGSCTGCHTSASHTGAAFLSKWGGRPLSELFGFVSTRMPKANPGSLSDDEYVLVVAYVLKLNGMPSGKAELSADPDDLNAIRFDGAASDLAKPARNSQIPRSRVPLPRHALEPR